MQMPPNSTPTTATPAVTPAFMHSCTLSTKPRLTGSRVVFVKTQHPGVRVGSQVVMGGGGGPRLGGDTHKGCKRREEGRCRRKGCRCKAVGSHRWLEGGSRQSPHPGEVSRR